MKKMICVLILAVLAVSVFAEMDSRAFSASLVTTNVGTQVFVLRGTVEGVYATIPTGKTGTIALATSEGQFFSKSMTSATDGLFLPRAALHSTAGVALTEVDNGSNTNALVGSFPLAGPVTATFTPAADTTGTNSYSVTVIYNK